MIFISILTSSFVVARTEFSRHARRVRCNSIDFNWITTLSITIEIALSMCSHLVSLFFVLLSSFYFSPLSSQSSTYIIIRIIFRGHLWWQTDENSSPRFFPERCLMVGTIIIASPPGKEWVSVWRRCTCSFPRSVAGNRAFNNGFLGFLLTRASLSFKEKCKLKRGFLKSSSLCLCHSIESHRH